MFEIRTDNKVTKSVTSESEIARGSEVQKLHDWVEVEPTGDPVTVAVMDSGIDQRAVDTIRGPFQNTEVTKRHDVTGSGTGEDAIGHGTGVASIIGGATSKVELYSVRIFGSEGRTGMNEIQEAYEWLLAHADEIDVVNMSWGTTQDVPEINQLHERLISKGIHDVVAAGNCLTGNTWVLTTDGWKRMHNLYRMGEGTGIISYDEETGEFVKDDVTETFKRDLDDDEKLLRIYTDEGHVVEATEDHKFLTSEGYKRAGNLSTDDEIITRPDADSVRKVPDFYDGKTNPAEKGVDLAEGAHPSGQDHVQFKEKVEVECPNCGNKKEIKPHRAHSEKGFCSSKCSAEYHDLVPPQISSEEAKNRMPDKLPEIGAEALKEWREKNPEEQKRLAQNKTFLGQRGDPSTLPHNPNVAKKGAYAAHEKLRDSDEKTSIEKAVAEMLDEIGVSYEDEYLLKNENGGMLTAIDFAFPERKIAVYCDGNYWHNYPDGTDKDRRITTELESRGWKVMRFWENDIQGSPDEVKRKLGKEITNGASVTRIEEIENKTVYDVSVKGNHNFIANGLVVHNSGSDGGSPATASKAFSAGAVDEDGKPVRFSSFDPDQGNPDVAAVGKNVVMARAPGTSMGVPINDSFTKASGTSFSAPYTAAAYVNGIYKKRQSWDEAFKRASEDIPGTKKDGAGLLKLKPALESDDKKRVVDASAWNFKGNDTVWINADWLSEKATSAEKLDETKDHVDIRFKK